MSTAIAVVALIFASVACALSLAVAARAKKILDPMVEGSMVRRLPIEPGTTIPDVGALRDHVGVEVDLYHGQEETWLLAFLSSGCTGCAQQTPDYKRLVNTEKIHASRAITIVLGSGDEADKYAQDIAQFSRVIRPQDNLDPLISGLGVKSFPTFVVMTPGGVVKYSTPSVSSLAASSKELVGV